MARVSRLVLVWCAEDSVFSLHIEFEFGCGYSLFGDSSERILESVSMGLSDVVKRALPQAAEKALKLAEKKKHRRKTD